MTPLAALVGYEPGSPPAYRVTAAAIQDYAAAIGEPDEGDDGAAVAPPTFPILVAFRAMQALLDDPEVDIALHRVVHADQRFEYTRPVRAGDELTAFLRVESVRSMGGAELLSTRTRIDTAEGEPVCTAYATLVHRGEAQQA